MSDPEIKCPYCKEMFAIDGFHLSSGNHEMPCEECGKQVGFHVELEIDGIHKADLDEE